MEKEKVVTKDYIVGDNGLILDGEKKKKGDTVNLKEEFAKQLNADGANLTEKEASKTSNKTDTQPKS